MKCKCCGSVEKTCPRCGETYFVGCEVCDYPNRCKIWLENENCCSDCYHENGCVNRKESSE